MGFENVSGIFLMISKVIVWYIILVDLKGKQKWDNSTVLLFIVTEKFYVVSWCTIYLMYYEAGKNGR